MTIAFTTLDGALGRVTLAARADDAAPALCGLWFDGQKYHPVPTADWRRDDGHAVLRAAREQVLAYEAGERVAFDLPLAPRGTEFQRRVWSGLLGVRYGETITYAELARRIDAPRAVRAVGAAVGRNPMSVIVPCHRIVGGDGSLTGYAGGLARKRWLLEREGAPAVA